MEILEDPVCGSAHAILGPYWAERLGSGSKPMVGKHVSKRTGEIGVCVDEKGQRVRLQGHSITVAKGEIFFSL